MSVELQVSNFLKKYKMHHSAIDLKAQTECFYSEMQSGLKGEPSSLMMLPTYISVPEQVKQNQPVVVIDAGGTNFRVAVVTFRENSAEIADYNVYPMPGSQGTITKQEFFDTIVKWLIPVIEKSRTIGFCYSYPSKILPNMDGEFIEFNKQVSVTGMQGVKLGEELNLALEKKGISKREICVLNDTVASMLGGISEYRSADSYIALVLGTGFNICYIEETENITKDKYAVSTKGKMAINMESGGFAYFPRGVMDKRMDSKTDDPDEFKFEKMIAGAYQGSTFFEVVKQAAEDKIFSTRFTEKFEAVENLIPLWEIDGFINNSKAPGLLNSLEPTEEDRELLLELFEQMYHRAGRMIVVALAATIKASGKGRSPDKPVFIITEGTTFKKSSTLQKYVNLYVKDYLNDELGLYCEFRSVKNSTLLGTAIAGLNI